MNAATADLLAAAADGDQQAWDALVDRFTGLLWTVARSHRLSTADAADVVQTTWLRFVEQLGRIREPERAGAWLATTCRRESLRVLRRDGRQVPTDDERTLERPDTTAVGVEDLVVRVERDQLLWAAVEALPDRCRQLLRVLAADPAPSYEEVSAALAMPVGSIGPTRGRCLQRLRAIVGDVGVSAGS